MSKSESYISDPNSKILKLEDIDLSLTYSYANYLTWFFDDRVELIKGKVNKRSPAPSPVHQEISVNISPLFINISKGKAVKFIMHHLMFGSLKKAKLTEISIQFYSPIYVSFAIRKK